MSVLFGAATSQLTELLEESSSIPEVGGEWAELPSVQAGGCATRPRLALTFINPTYRNQSARESWRTGRAPFIGLRRIWTFLASCGLIDAAVVEQLPSDGKWTPADATALYGAVAESGLYITNLVKACRKDSVMPTPREARQWLPLLEEELDLVRPEVVVGMGTLVSSLILGQQVKLGAHFEAVDRASAPLAVRVPGRDFELVPCYFPVGRGNPTKARSILAALDAAGARRSVA